MHIEVELKAHIDEPESLRERVKEIGAQFVGEFHKDDRYFRYLRNGSYEDVRIRGENAVYTITFKDKSISQGIETNGEHEFSVSDPDEASELLHRLGAKPLVRKTKIGSAWSYEGITIEISNVQGLGYFVEIEILLNDSKSGPISVSNEYIGSARTRLLNLLDLLGVDHHAIEPRTYTSMLLNI